MQFKKILVIALFVATGAWVVSSQAQEKKHDHDHDHGHGHGNHQHDHDHGHKQHGHDHGHGHAHGEGHGHDKDKAHGEHAYGDMKMSKAPLTFHHKLQLRSVGTWNVKQSIWMAPGTEPMTADATEVVTPILDGLGVTFDYQCKGEMAFQGYGFSSWSPAKNKYVCIWLDSVSGTGPSHYEMTWDESTQTMSGTMIAHGGMEQRIVSKIESDDSHTMAFYMKMPDGSEFKNMELAYSRAK